MQEQTINSKIYEIEMFELGMSHVRRNLNVKEIHVESDSKVKTFSFLKRYGQQPHLINNVDLHQDEYHQQCWLL